MKKLKVLHTESQVCEDSASEMLPNWKQKRMLKQQYRLVGNHTAVKICYYCKESLKNKGHCYKKDFYDIPTEKCLEMSPAITCNQRCKHCWRDTSVYSKKWKGPVDNPKEIILGCLEARKELLMGFGGNDKVDKKKFLESLKPTHAAISLTGEPMMYPKIAELTKEFFNQNFKTVFIVTSGTCPEAFDKFKELNVWPTNFYLSLEASNKEMYKKICVPVLNNAWEKIQKSMDVMSNIPCRTVMRITCIKGLNMENPKEFIQWINKMKPDVVECKSFQWIGYAQYRLELKNVPNFEEVMNFAKELENENYKITKHKKGADIVLLERLNK